MSIAKEKDLSPEAIMMRHVARATRLEAGDETDRILAIEEWDRAKGMAGLAVAVRQIAFMSSVADSLTDIEEQLGILVGILKEEKNGK